MRLLVWFLSLFFLLSIFASKTHAQTPEQFSFENAEKLKPLIHWHEYSEQAFLKADKEHKPIFLLLTAPSWCYACQEYESKQYLYNPQIVKILNEQFIPVYVDSDKRADLTRQYLLGGWPTTIILTPQKKQLTAFLGRRSPAILTNILNDSLTRFRNNPNTPNPPNALSYQKTAQIIPTDEQLEIILSKHITFLKDSNDPLYGGFGTTGRKYPQGRSLDFMLDLYELTHNPMWLGMVQTTLTNQYTKVSELQTNYHLYDPIEGGFHRLSSNRSWRNPHFEKMLYDNARLLKSYDHLLKLAPDPLAQEVVNKTQTYILTNWYDSQKGGFWASTDPGNGGLYYIQTNRTKMPRADKTKYIPWNAEAILTFLYLLKTTNDPQYKVIAEKSLNWTLTMQSENGAYHYQTEDGKKYGQGNLLDNAYLLLALVDGYETLNNEPYLKAAAQLANYSLNHLYDLNSGGFFERNSKDATLYPPDEQVLLTKPFEENSIIAYSLLKLYKTTNNPYYLDAGIKTVGSLTPFFTNLNVLYAKQSAEGPYIDADSGYYFMQAEQLIQKENLLSEFDRNQQTITKLENDKLKHFWLNNFSNPSSPSIPSNTSFLLLLLIAFLAGALSCLSPCVLPILPTFLAYSLKSSKRNLFGMTISFFAGLSIIFVALGMSATIIGSFLKTHIIIFSQIAGILIMSFGVFTLLGKELPGFKLKQNKPTSYLGSFLFGGAFGLSWSPCVGPILVSILTLAATVDSVFKGAVLLFFYSLGLSLPLILLTFFLKNRSEQSLVWRLLKGKEIKLNFFGKLFQIHSTTLISGVLFLLLGYLMFSGTLYSLNKYVSTTFFQNLLFTGENWLLKLIP